MSASTQTANGTNGLNRQILLLSAAAFGSGASARIGDPLIPQLAQQFSATPGEAAHVVSAFALAYGCCQMFYGPLGDRYGKFRIITLVAFASLLGVLACALAADLQGLVLARFLTGTTAAAIIPLSMAWIADNVPYERRQHVLAYYFTGQIVGVISGQIIGGVFADLTGWRGAFWCQLAIFAVIATLLARERRRSPDIDHRPQVTVSKAGFIDQLRSIFRSNWSRFLLLWVGVEGALLFGALAFIPTYLHQRFGISLTLAGLAIGMFGLGGASYTTQARTLVKKLGETGLSTLGGVCAGAAFLMLLFANHWLWVLPAGWFMGFGFYMQHSTLQINATQMAPQAQGTAVSLFASCFFFGQSLGVAFAAFVMDRIGAFAIFGSSAVLLPIVGLVFSWRLKAHRASLTQPLSQP